MDTLLIIIVVVASYLIGSIPSGVVIVKLVTGKDIRQVESGRTGGTNAFRAAGIWAGVGTALLDGLKGAVAVWLAKALFPADPWVHVLAGLGAILGHNYSIFIIERNEQGRLRLRGGAGGAPTVGAAFALWPASILIILPLGALIFYFIGYASITTMSVPFLAALIFACRAWNGSSPWEYVWFGVLAELILIWALQPNIRRLLDGTERIHGFRARVKK